LTLLTPARENAIGVAIPLLFGAGRATAVWIGFALIDYEASGAA
jgi:hypothetical protein